MLTRMDLSAIRTDLERLVSIPSIAFPGFPREPLEEAAETVKAMFDGCPLRRRAG